MKKQLFLCVLGMILLLCGCQKNAVNNAPPPTDNPESQQSEPAEPADEPPTDEPAEPQKESEFPPEPEVCTVPFTETESFPLPFEDELYTNKWGVLYLSIGQALYDYDTMWQLLEDNFPLLDAIKRELEIDWVSVKEKYRNTLEERARDGYISQQMFLVTIYDCLSEFRQIGHLCPMNPAARDFRVDFYSDFDLVERSGNPNFLYLITQPKTELFYDKYEELPPIPMKSRLANECWEDFDFSNVQMNTIDESAGVFIAYPEGIPYLRIPSMSNWSEDTYKATRKFLDEIKNEDHLIIDIRKNGGGNDCVWQDGIVAPLIDSDTQYALLWGVKSGALNSALYPPEKFGTEIYQDEAWQKDFPCIHPESLDGMDILIKLVRNVPAHSEQEHFNGKIWVLVDNGCYSSADSFANYCKVTGFATLVGTQTGGSGAGVMSYMMVLPYSGLIIKYEPCLAFNPDGTCNQTTGTVPDIIPADGVSALQECLTIIQTNTINGN